MKKGYNPDLKDIFGRTPLSLAAENGHEMVVKLLLATDGVDLESADDTGETPLTWAAGAGQVEVVKLLLEHGADPGADPVTWDSRTPLSWASEFDYKEVMKNFA